MRHSETESAPAGDSISRQTRGRKYLHRRGFQRDRRESRWAEARLSLRPRRRWIEAYLQRWVQATVLRWRPGFGTQTTTAESPAFERRLTPPCAWPLRHRDRRAGLQRLE